MAEANDKSTNPSTTELNRIQEVVERPIESLDNDGEEVQDTSVGEDTTKIIQELTRDNEEITRKFARAQEELQKHDKEISEERQARQAAEERCKQLENQLEVEKQTQGLLKQEIERLAGVGGSDETGSGPSMEPLDPTEQIEMLKQQICAYADDFAKEQSDREIVQADRDALQERVKEYEREIALLNEQLKKPSEYERRVVSKCDAGNQTSYQNTETGRSQESRELGATAVEPTQDMADRQLLKAALEIKNAVMSELEQKRLDLEKLLKDRNEQLEKANEIKRTAELKVEENERKCAELKHKCDEFFWQATGLLIQQQESEHEINSLRLLLIDLVQDGMRLEEHSRVINNVLLVMTRRAL